MRLMVIDGNSILNRAFYGIKLLTTKDGKFTNGIYGFLSILLRLTDEVKPDGVAIAFDVKAPTFRHKMYDGYKAQRKGMPAELAQQMPTLKELLRALGYTLLECEGWEADDILGTLAKSCQSGDECYIATGDRDSLQLVDANTKVLLTSTKMGRPQTVIYDEEKIKEVYSVKPLQLIEIKALQGDSSDNIPGVPGVGEKTAGDLIQRFECIENIYNNIDTLDIKDSVRKKLIDGKDLAFLSRKLGTISCEAPIDKDYSLYTVKESNNFEAVKLLSELEMFSMIERLHLDPKAAPAKKESKPAEKFSSIECDNTSALLASLKAEGKMFFTLEIQDGEVNGIYIRSGTAAAHISALNLCFMSFIEEAFEDGNIQKTTDDSKAAYKFALDSGIKLKNVSFDTQLAGYILNPSSNDYGVNRLCMEYSVPLPQEESSPAVSAWLLPELEKVLCEKLKENGQLELLEETEIPLAQVLASMELTGFEVDRSGIAEFGKKLEADIEKITDEIYEAVGYEFNLNSPKQLGEALFEKLKLPAKKKTKSGWSTSAEQLEKLAQEYPVVANVLQYRTWAKLKSTYCDGLIKAIASDGRIHSTFNQTETRTGRISSTEPNLQNIPVRSELGREMRKFFKAKEGFVLVDADYSQIELRVLAHVADDETMINAFNSGDDIHTITASQVFNMPINMVTPLMRSRAKAVNFGIVYGIGAFSLAQNIGVTRAEADAYIKGYLRHYSAVDRYMERIVETAKECGYVKTLFNRRRYLPELTSGNGMLRAFGERVARNMPIQGTAADIIKIAMVRVYNRLKAENLRAKLIMQVHDELIIEAPENEKEKVCALLKEEMENAVQLKIKMLADVNYGKTWYDAKG